MLRFVRQVVNEGQDFHTSTQINVLNSTAVLLDNNNTNSTNNGSSLFSAFLSSSKKQGFAAWEFNWHWIILSIVGLVFVILLLGIGIYNWCIRVNKVRRRNSLPLAVDDLIETTKIQEKRLSSSPNKAPPVPPRPTAYTTVLGRVEYRSNL